MHPNTGGSFTDRELLALASGQARIWHGRVVPIMRGAEGEGETDEQKTAREAEEAAAAAAATASADRSFSQAEVDRIVQDRLARAKAKPPEDYEELKARAAKLDEIEESNKTELQKERDRAAKAEARATQVEAEAKEIRLRAAILAEAAKPDRKVVDTDAVIALLDRATLELDDNGNPTNIAKAMDSLLEAKPFLVAANGGARGNADLGARGGGKNQLSSADLKTMTPDQIVAARKEGRLDSVMRGTV